MYGGAQVVETGSWLISAMRAIRESGGEFVSQFPEDGPRSNNHVMIPYFFAVFVRKFGRLGWTGRQRSPDRCGRERRLIITGCVHERPESVRLGESSQYLPPRAELRHSILFASDEHAPVVRVLSLAGSASRGETTSDEWITSRTLDRRF